MLRFTTALVATFTLAPMALAGTEYPLTLNSCGHDITIDRAPESVVSVGQGTTEILYMLGLGDKLAGTALWVNPVLPEFAELDAGIERLADNVPSFESVLQKRPELVVTAYEWMIGPQGAVGTPQMFDDAGIASWVMPTDCLGKDNRHSVDGARNQMFDTALLYQTIEELALIFDVQDRGAQLIADLRAREAAAVEQARALDLPGDMSALFWYSSADIDIDPYVAGSNGVPGWMLSRLGVRNVIASPEEWPMVGWETIARADPGFVVIADMERRRFLADDLAVKRDFLLSDPVTSQMQAVREGRILTIEANAMDPTVRSIFALEALSDALAGFGSLP